jgi:hypothetical protein
MVGSRFSICLRFFFVAFFCIVSILCAGCGIFGGGKEAKEPSVTDAEAEHTFAPEERAVPEAEFESDELDVEVEILTIEGSLNWSKGFVQAKGFGVFPPDEVNEEVGRLLALRAAKVDAQANLLEITAGAYVTSATAVENYTATNYEVKSKVEAIIKGARELAAEYNVGKKAAVVQLGIYLEDVAKAIPKEDLPSDGEIKFYEWGFKKDTTLYTIAGNNEDLEASIRTSKSLEELEKKLEQLEQTVTEPDAVLLAAIEKLYQEIRKLKDIGESVKDLSDHTGVVINAAGASVEPTMNPSIYYRDGDELRLLYGKSDGRRKSKDVLAGWSKTLADAANHDRVRKNPLFVSAIEVSQESCSFVISDRDAKMVKEINEAKHLLEDCRVVIIN